MKTDLQRKESKIAFTTKLSPDQIDLRTLDKHMLAEFLDEQIRVRELPIEAQIKRVKKI